MDLTRVAVPVVLTGLGLIVVGLVALFGPWALIAAGLVLVILGVVVVDWERVS